MSSHACPHGDPPTRNDGVLGDWRTVAPVLLEKNLSKCGLFTVANSHVPLDHVKRATVRYELDGRTVEATVEVHPSPALGLPTIADQDKWFALLRLLLQRWGSLAEATNPFTFSTPDLLRTLRLATNSGKNYRDVQRWLDVMSATTIVSHESVYFAGSRRWARERCRLFDHVVSAGCALADGSIAEWNYVWFSSWLLENLRRNHVIFLDFNQYLLLNRPMAKGLVPLLQPGLWAGRHRGWYARSYSATCEVLGMRHYTQRSKVIEKLEPALDELRHAQFISGWSIEPATQGKDLKIVVHLQPREAGSISAVSSGPSDSRAPKTPASFLSQLTERGLHPTTAERLLSGLPATQPVEAQIAWFDRHVASAAGRAIRNRPAFLYRVLQEGLGELPSTGKAEASPEQPQVQVEDDTASNWCARRESLEAYEAYVQTEIAHYLDALPADEFRRLIDASAETLRCEHPFLRNAPPENMEAPARAHLRRQVRQELPLKSVADFAREQEHRQPEQVSA